MADPGKWFPPSPPSSVPSVPPPPPLLLLRPPHCPGTRGGGIVTCETITTHINVTGKQLYICARVCVYAVYNISCTLCSIEFSSWLICGDSHPLIIEKLKDWYELLSFSTVPWLIGYMSFLKVYTLYGAETIYHHPFLYVSLQWSTNESFKRR